MRDLETDRRGGGREGEERGRGREGETKGQRERNPSGRQQGNEGQRLGQESGRRERREEGGPGWVRKWSVGDVTLHGGGLEMRMLPTGPLPKAWRASPGPLSWVTGELWEASRLQRPSDTFPFSPTLETRETEVRAVCDLFGGWRCGHRGLWGEPLCLGQRSVSAPPDWFPSPVLPDSLWPCVPFSEHADVECTIQQYKSLLVQF